MALGTTGHFSQSTQRVAREQLERGRVLQAHAVFHQL